MSVHHVVLLLLLALTAVSCWAGVLGMWRMRDPTQALHYLSLPASLGAIALTAAAFMQVGVSQVGLKTCMIAVVLLGINSIVTHATARAFRVRKLGHWEPRKGDPLEFVGKDAGL